MGRGYGATQRRLLERLRANTADPLGDQRRAWQRPSASCGHEGQVAAARSWTRLVDIVGRNATPAAYESARRGLYRLRERGVIQTAYLTESGRRCLAARITPSAETAEGFHTVRVEQNAQRRAEREARRPERGIRPAEKTTLPRQGDDVSVGTVRPPTHREANGSPPDPLCDQYDERSGNPNDDGSALWRDPYVRIGLMRRYAARVKHVAAVRPAAREGQEGRRMRKDDNIV